MALFPRGTFYALIVLGALLPRAATADSLLFESGTLGPTGVPHADLNNGTVPGTNIKDSVFTGVRFHLSQPVVTSRVGGHFVANSIGTFFGAIVELEDANDFPDSFDFTTSDFVGSTLLEFPAPSEEVFGDLSLALDPGWYALVFGSGLFGATTNGATVRNGTDIDNPTYIAAQPNSGVGWFDITSSGPDHRFVVSGHIVPEPSTITLLSTALLATFARNRLQ